MTPDPTNAKSNFHKSLSIKEVQNLHLQRQIEIPKRSIRIDVKQVKELVAKVLRLSTNSDRPLTLTIKFYLDDQGILLAVGTSFVYIPTSQNNNQRRSGRPTYHGIDKQEGSSEIQQRSEGLYLHTVKSCNLSHNFNYFPEEELDFKVGEESSSFTMHFIELEQAVKFKEMLSKIFHSSGCRTTGVFDLQFDLDDRECLNSVECQILSAEATIDLCLKEKEFTYSYIEFPSSSALDPHSLSPYYEVKPARRHMF